MTSDELKYAAEYYRGYTDGKKAKSADEWWLANDREEAVRKLRKMTIGSNHYGNFQRIALAIGTEYDGKNFASECVRNRLIYLLGGDDVSSVPLLTYDTLGNERHKAVCRLVESRPVLGMSKVEILCDLGKAITDAPDFDPSEIGHLDLMWNTLIHLLGGENGTCPNDDGTCPNYVPIASNVSEQTITSELREWAQRIFDGKHQWAAYPYLQAINAIADRIDAQFDRICEQQERVLQETIDQMVDAHEDEVQSVHDDMEHECNELAAKFRQCQESYLCAKDERDANMQLAIDMQAIAEDYERECNDLLELLRDAAEDYRKLQAMYQMREGVLDAALSMLKVSVELPKDAEGVPIRVGDTICGYGENHRVKELSLHENGEWKFTNERSYFFENMAAFTHVKPATTAESIVRDLTLGKISEQEAVKLIETLER